jgi:hypothetical protein
MIIPVRCSPVATRRTNKNTFFAAVHESVHGTNAKCAMSAIWSLSGEKRTSRTSRFCRYGGHTRWAAARGGGARQRSLASRPQVPRGCCEQALRPRAQSEGGVTASEIYMRQSEPPCSRKSAVPGGIFGSLASSNGAQPIDRAEV